MSTLVKALKNLEARSIRESGGKALLAHLADKSRAPSPDPPTSTGSQTNSACQPSPIDPLPADSPLAYLSAGMPTVVLDRPLSPPSPSDVPPDEPLPADLPPVDLAGATAGSSNSASDDPGKAAARVEPPATTAGSSSTAGPAAELRRSQPPPALSPRTTARPPRPPTRLENTVRRILAEPERSEAFRQVADRLRADLTQVSGRSLVIAGIGPASDTYEVVLHAAAILAEAGEPILIIDGDVVRRSLTSELELKHGTGLVELALGEIPESDPIQELTLVNLSILPAGMARMPDPLSVTDRLTSLIESLEGSYRF